MKQWEYKFLILECYTKEEEHSRRLNELGKEGWEIVGTLPGYIVTSADCTLGFLLFKREIPDSSNTQGDPAPDFENGWTQVRPRVRSSILEAIRAKFL